MTNRKQRRANKDKQEKKPSKVQSIASSSADPLWNQLTQGMEHQKAGRLVEAEKIYRSILDVNPNHAHTLHMMALLALEIKQYGVAEELAKKAIKIQPSIEFFYNTLANILNTSGKHIEAETIYRQIAQKNPASADAHNNLGATLSALRKENEAIDAYKKALELNPKHYNALTNLGTLFHNQKKYAEASSLFKQAFEINPSSVEVCRHLAKSLYFSNKVESGKQYFEQVLKLNSDDVESLSFLGRIFRDQGKYEEALLYYKRLNSIQPSGFSHANVGLVLQDLGRATEATIQYKEALKHTPDSYEFYNNLALLYNDMARYEEAYSCYENALRLNPNNPLLLSNAAATYKDLGFLDKAIELLKRAISITPDHGYLYSNLLFVMLYAASVKPEELASTSRIFGEKIVDPLLIKKAHSNNKNTERKLRIGYVSPDFFKHAVHYFLEPLLILHDRTKFEIFAYSNTPKEDDVTERIKKEVDHWRDIRFLSDEKITSLIEADSIDILVDLTGHTGKNNLRIFAQKPAPIQITWLGYPATTGMKAIDYRITDIYAEPVGMTEHLNTETLWRLPQIFCCYQPSENSPAVIDHSPFEDNDYITFGCFNNFAKVTDDVMRTWSKIMAQVPKSQLLLEIFGVDIAMVRDQVQKRLEAAGIPLDRVILETRRRTNQYILYNRIDIALDPYPCNGGTTSMDTMWMGVPMITLAGRHFVSRMGVTILTNAGLPELIANSEDAYVKITVDLANDRERLKKMRHGLQEKVVASPLMDQKLFARNMEAAYREMWKIWCQKDND